MSQQEMLVTALSAIGCREVVSRSRKYRVFERAQGTFYFIGRNGAVRKGQTVSNSFSVTEGPTKIALLKVAEWVSKCPSQPPATLALDVYRAFLNVERFGTPV